MEARVSVKLGWAESLTRLSYDKGGALSTAELSFPPERIVIRIAMLMPTLDHIRAIAFGANHEIQAGPSKDKSPLIADPETMPTKIATEPLAWLAATPTKLDVFGCCCSGLAIGEITHGFLALIRSTWTVSSTPNSRISSLTLRTNFSP